MGYLNNSVITVDAVLTNKGRELLAKGEQYFNITQFALADDEVDYSLYDVSHPLGSNYYGEAIQNMPILEAFPDADQSMKYKLITLPQGSKFIPVINVPVTSYTLTSNSRNATISPSTGNASNGNSLLGYTAILSDSSVATLSVTPGHEVKNQSGLATAPVFLSDDGTSRSVAVTGFKFDISYISQTNTKSASLIIIGNETGGRITLSITANVDQLYSSSNVVPNNDGN